MSAEDPYESHISQSFAPSAVCPLTEQETIQQSIQDHQTSSQSTLMWPSIGGTPINEFSTEGYFSMAFPTLFPTGAADFHGQRCHQVTIGNYFKHLMMYEGGRFAKHPRFRFISLNTEMRWRALQIGRIYVRQHPGDAQLTVDELRDMVDRKGGLLQPNTPLCNKSQRHHGKQYWFRQRSRLISMVDTLSLSTIFFTLSAADMQWPELARLICPEDPYSRSSRAKVIVENPALADWFFYHRVQKFVEAFFIGILGAMDYWMRFLAWLPNAPDVEQLLVSADTFDGVKEEIIQFADKIVSTVNPAVLPDGSNIADAPLPKTEPHICNKAYSEVTDFSEDLSDLVATCQRHTHCSEAYCLCTRNGRQ